MYFNIQSLIANFNELEQVLINQTFDIIVLSETRLTENISDNEVNIEKYNLIRCDSLSRHTGGVAIYVNANLQCEQVYTLVVNMDIWCLAVKVRCGFCSFVIAGLYRSPSSSNRQFCDRFNELMDNLVKDNNNLIIVGDFNIDWFDENNIYRRDCNKIILENGCTQLVNEPTRITSTSRTLIDYVVSNLSYLVANVSGDFDIADHEAISLKLPMRAKFSKPKVKKIQVLKYSKANLLSAFEESGINSLVVNDIHQYAKNFQNKLLMVLIKFKTLKYPSKKENSWFNQHLNALKHQKHNAKSKAIFTGSLDDWCYFRNIRNTYTKELNHAKNNFIKRSLENCTNQKAMWRTLKSLVLREKKVK